MSVVVFIESINNKLKKSSFEAVNYGSKLAKMQSSSCVVITNANAQTAEQLGHYGADKVLTFSGNSMHDGGYVSDVIKKAYQQVEGKTLVLEDNSRGKTLMGKLAIKLKAGVVSSADSLPDLSNGFHVRRGVFSGKAFATYELTSDHKLISVARNAIGIEEISKEASVENLDVSEFASKVDLVEVKRVEGIVPLPEAELVVSAGRGMKEPGNWGIIDELANVLGATTACSRPVADIGWRPHHEHVGQTGIAIKPNLYIAIGISGAIQHLAGVNSSKTIVVINKDPEAPFFKAADYGIVGDLFDVVPRLTESLKKFKSA